MSSNKMTKNKIMRRKMTNGERLRLFRENKGLNQTQISKALNIPPRNWSRYETDKTSPPQDVLVNLAKIGLDIHWYMTGESENRLTSQPPLPCPIPPPVVLWKHKGRIRPAFP
jgi:transcriptional regulator with XRE-family HTH domain